MSPGRCATSAAAQSSSARCAINRRIALSRRVTPAPPRPERRSTMRSIAWQAPSFAAKSADLGQDRAPTSADEKPNRLKRPTFPLGTGLAGKQGSRPRKHRCDPRQPYGAPATSTYAAAGARLRKSAAAPGETSSLEPPRTRSVGTDSCAVAARRRSSTAGQFLFTEREPSRNRGSQCQRQRPFESSRRFFFSPSSEAGLDGAANRRRQPRRPPRSRRSRRGRGRA